jgi:ribose transport system substrate-binding protein
MERGAEAEANALGVNLTVTGPADFGPSEQAPILNAIAVSKPNALIVAPTDSSALNPELSRIAGEGDSAIPGHAESCAGNRRSLGKFQALAHARGRI